MPKPEPVASAKPMPVETPTPSPVMATPDQSNESSHDGGSDASPVKGRRQGYLQKIGGFMKSQWQRRYFIVEDGTLY